MNYINASISGKNGEEIVLQFLKKSLNSDWEIYFQKIKQKLFNKI